MIARLLRRWFDDLCQLKTGAIASVVACGVALGAVIAMCTHKPPWAGSLPVQSSTGHVQAARQPKFLAACAAPSAQPQAVVHGATPAQGYAQQSAPNAYNILVPDCGGTTYRLKTIVNQ